MIREYIAWVKENRRRRKEEEKVDRGYGFCEWCGRGMRTRIWKFDKKTGAPMYEPYCQCETEGYI